MYVFGYIGSFLCAACGIPEAFRSIRLKSCSVGWGFLLTWLVGELCLLSYNFELLSVPLFFNYVINIICILIMIYYKLRR